MLVCHDDNPQQALVAENQNVNAAPPPSKPEDCHRINTFFTTLDKVLTEIENGFGGNDQDVLCVLGDITPSDLPSSERMNECNLQVFQTSGIPSFAFSLTFWNDSPRFVSLFWCFLFSFLPSAVARIVSVLPEKVHNLFCRL